MSNVLFCRRLQLSIDLFLGLLFSCFNLINYFNLKLCPAGGPAARARTSLASLILIVALWPLPAHGEVSCVPLEYDLLLATSGAWSEDGETLLVADAFRERLIHIAPDGTFRGHQNSFDRRGSGAALTLRRPSFIHRASDGLGYFMEDEEEDTITPLGGDLVAGTPVSVKSSSQGLDSAARRLIGLYGWQPMEHGFVGFGDIEYRDIKGPGRYKSAFLHFDASGITRVFDEPMDTLSEVRNHYLRNMPYIATLDGETAYFLYMEDEPSIVRAEVGVEDVVALAGFPQDFRHAPRLERNPEWARALEGPRQATAFYRQIERSRMAAGLYAWNGRLFLAAKEAMNAERETAWWLIELNPSDGEEIARARLPTDAAHITLVPGETFAVIEKQPVEGLRGSDAPYMETCSMALVPAAWLEDSRGRQLRIDPACGCSR